MNSFSSYVRFFKLCACSLAVLMGANAAERSPVRLVVIIERSVSMSNEMAYVRDAAVHLTSRFGGGDSRLGLVVFGSSAIVAFPPRDPAHPDNGSGPAPDFLTAVPSIRDLIGSVQPASNAGLAEALWLGYRELAKKPIPGALDAIVLFTRGRPNGISAEFNDPDPVHNLLRAESTCLHKPWGAVSPMRGVIAQGCSFRPECPSGSAVLGIRQLINTTVDEAHPNAMAWLKERQFEPVIPSPASEGCAYLDDPRRVAEDVRQIPAVDLYGNSTAGSGYTESALYKQERIPLDLKAIKSPYQIGLASWNAADDAARRIREDTRTNIAIHVIAVGGTREPPDETLLKRIANVKSDDNRAYGPTRASGLCVRANSPHEIAAATATIAQEIATSARSTISRTPPVLKRD